MPRVLGEELRPYGDGDYRFCRIFDGAVRVGLSSDTTSVNPWHMCTIEFGGGGPSFYGGGRTQSEAIQAAEEKFARLCRVIVQLGFTEPRT